MKINVLGSMYNITVKKYESDKTFEKNSFDGYCSAPSREIVVCDMATFPGWEDASPEEVKNHMKYVTRHEIVHAFYNESGLQDSSCKFEGPWARNEEMVDWIAVQGPKIYDAWKKAGAV